MIRSELVSESLPTCSIVIPVFNRQSTVAKTVESCLAQDYQGIQVILVDDGSTDNSAAICTELASATYTNGKSVSLVSQENAGACAARNHGMSLATGEFLLFLDSDDVIPTNKISRQISLMTFAKADCCICDYKTIDASDRLLSIYRNNLTPRQFITRLKSPSNSAILMRRSSLPPTLQWNTNLKRMQDVDFMLRYLSGVNKWVYVPEPLYHYRLHEGPRISDTYREGMPYGELFMSMVRYLRVHPPVAANSTILIATYGARLGLAKLKDTASRVLPESVKSLLRGVRKKTNSTTASQSPEK